MLIYTLAGIGTITILILIFRFLNLFLNVSKYNQDIVPFSYDEKLINSSSFITLTYQEIITLANTLYDLHRELDNPPGFRLLNYPTKTLKKVHDKMHKTLINASLSLEQAFKKGKSNGEY